MVSLMDRLLKLENLDLQLTPYRVLATGPDEGMVEFVPSTSLAQVRVSATNLILDKSSCSQNKPLFRSYHRVSSACSNVLIKRRVEVSFALPERASRIRCN